MTLDKFPIIELEGSPKEVGFKHGSILKERIHSTVKWYKNIIAREEKELFALASHFKSKISRFNPTYCEEIDAIAAGAAIDPQWIYILNARSEIMSIFSNECTAVFFKNSAILGQNWDWAQELENLGVILNIKLVNKPAILMMTEPGIIGKIGFNAHGVGTCLNFLDSGEQCKGIPIHIILRAILEEASIEDATNSIKSVLKGKSANVLIGDHTGRSIDLEFANEQVYHPDTSSNVFIHTNHYLENEDLNTNTEKLANSFARYTSGVELSRHIDPKNVEGMKKILLDRSRKDFPICRPYVDNPDIGNAGTVSTIIMDLKKLEMHITRGSPLKTPFSVINLRDG